jgi:hypothetical protein
MAIKIDGMKKKAKVSNINFSDENIQAVNQFGTMTVH